MAEKSADSTPSPSSPTSPLSLIIGEQTPGSPARSLKPRYLKACTSKSIDLGIDLHPLNRLKKLSSFGSDSLGEISTQTSQGDDKKLAQLYEAKLKRLQQKVTDLTRLYRESERDAQQKLQFWQNKFLSTFQALKSSQGSELSAEAVQQLSEKIDSLEQQMNTSLDQGGEEELRMHRFNKEMLSKLKSSHQEKKQLIDQMTQFNDKFSTISTTMDTYTHKLDTFLIDGDTEGVKRELQNARSTIERLVRERAELEEGLCRLQTGNGELRGELVAASSRESQLMSERNRVSTELSELKRKLQGREDELGERERDNLSLIGTLESLNGEIAQLRREVEARGRYCEENKQRHSIQSDDAMLLTEEQVELAECRDQLIQLQDQLGAAREKIHKQEDAIFSLRGNDKSEETADHAMEVASLQERLTAGQIELEEQRTQSEELIRKKRIELDLCHKKSLEKNQELTELLEQHSYLQQLHRDRNKNCEQLERQVTDLSKALQACLEMQEQLVETFHIKQQDIDKLTGQASTLQRELSKSTDNHIVTKTQLQALNHRLQVETDQVRSFEKKLRDATRDKNLLQQEISQLQQSHERSRSMTSPPDPDPEGVPTRHSYPYLSEEPLAEGVHRQMASSLPAVLAESKGSPNFSQNYRRALQKGLSQVELAESASKVRENPDSSPDSKLYWVRRVSEMSLQMKESSEYWSAQVKELTLQLEQAKHSDTEQ